MAPRHVILLLCTGCMLVNMAASQVEVGTEVADMGTKGRQSEVGEVGTGRGLTERGEVPPGVLPEGVLGAGQEARTEGVLAGAGNVAGEAGDVIPGKGRLGMAAEAHDAIPGTGEAGDVIPGTAQLATAGEAHDAVPRKGKSKFPSIKRLIQHDTTLPRVNVCKQPVKIGMCRARIPRFYFDSATGLCKKFFYGGCGSNGNNFETMRECVRRCGCSLPAKTGPCKAAKPRYYYRNGKCVKFTYGGCQGNSNNFRSKRACYGVCRRR